jgi:LPS-assembly protein
VVDVRQTLDLKRKGTVQQVLLLDLGQDFDLLENRAADAFGRLVGSFGPFTTTTVLRFDVGGRKLDQLSTEAMVDDKRGNAVYARYDQLLQGGSDALRAGIDTLVGEPYVCTPQDQLALAAAVAAGNTTQTVCPGYAEQLTAGIRFKLPMGLGARYEALVQPLAQPTPSIASPVPTSLQRFGAKIPQQTAGISYGPACDCWRFEVHAAIFPVGAPSVGASLTISHFGTFGN